MGIMAVSLAARGCCSKQKHSVLFKYREASPGEIEGNACAIRSWLVWFSTMKLTCFNSPGCMVIDCTSGRKDQGAPRSVRVVNSTVTVREVSITMPSIVMAAVFSVRPLKPVSSQNFSYKGTRAKPKANIMTTAARSLVITLELFCCCLVMLFHLRGCIEGVVGCR